MLSQNFWIATWRILGDGVSGCPPRMPLFALCWMLNSFALGQEMGPPDCKYRYPLDKEGEMAGERRAG